MKSAALAGVVAMVAGVPALAGQVELRVTVENLAPTNSVSFAPLRVGFGNGTFDAFNNGESTFLLGNPDVASAPIVTIAEGGSGSTWFPAFAAAEPNATLGTVVPDPAGPLLPGQSASATFMVDPSTNRYFTFAAMVVPSNDVFIGNDSPTQFALFDMMGNLAISSIDQRGRDIWDAGSEATDAANAALLVGGTNALRTPQNGVVGFDFMGLDAFNGLETAAGYAFNRQFAAGDVVYRISFEVVPAPGAVALLGMGGLVATRRRR